MRRGATGGHHELEAAFGRLAGSMEIASQRDTSRPAFRKAGPPELDEVAFGDALARNPGHLDEVRRRSGLAAEKAESEGERAEPHPAERNNRVQFRENYGVRRAAFARLTLCAML